MQISVFIDIYYLKFKLYILKTLKKTPFAILKILSFSLLQIKQFITKNCQSTINQNKTKSRGKSYV